jgi:hypothetical protein
MKSPAAWNVLTNDGTNVTAHNTDTKADFSGTLASFNQMLRTMGEPVEVSMSNLELVLLTPVSTTEYVLDAAHTGSTSPNFVAVKFTDGLPSAVGRGTLKGVRTVRVQGVAVVGTHLLKVYAKDHGMGPDQETFDFVGCSDSVSVELDDAWSTANLTAIDKDTFSVTIEALTEDLTIALTGNERLVFRTVSATTLGIPIGVDDTDKRLALLW